MKVLRLLTIKNQKSVVKYHTIMLQVLTRITKKSTFCQKVEVHKDQNPLHKQSEKNPACTSKRYLLELITLQYCGKSYITKITQRYSLVENLYLFCMVLKLSLMPATSFWPKIKVIHSKYYKISSESCTFL